MQTKLRKTKSKRTRIRLESWYWGNYEWSDSPIAIRNGWAIGGTANGYFFEEYDEERHGWHNSEEYKKTGREKYNNGSI